PNRRLAYGSLYAPHVAGACRVEQGQAGADVVGVVFSVSADNGYVCAVGFLEAKVVSVNLTSLGVHQQPDAGVSACKVLNDRHRAVSASTVIDQDFALSWQIPL